MTVNALAMDAGVQVIEKSIRMKRVKRFRKLPRMTARHELALAWIFQNASVELKGGDALIVLGDSSQQKMCFVRAICGILPADAGIVKVNRRSVVATKPRLRAVRHLSVGQTITMLAGLYGLTDEETKKRFNTIRKLADIKKADLNDPLEDYPTNLRAKISLAVAVAAPVDILGLDGVVTIGGVDFREAAIGELEGAMDQGRSLVLTTTDIPLIETIGTKAILLDEENSRELTIQQAVDYLNHPDRRKGRKRQHEDDDEEDEPEEQF